MNITKSFKLNTAKRDKMVSFRLPKELDKKLNEWCKKNGMKKSDALVYLVTDHILTAGY